MKKHKDLIKWLLVIAAICAVCIWNREYIPDIIAQIRQTPAGLLALASLLALAYYFCEGRIISLLAVKYNPRFSVRSGMAGAFFCEFYRLLTLGSMTAVAEIYFLHTRKIPAAKGTGMCLVQYLIQRLTIAFLGILASVVVLLHYPKVIREHTGQIILSYLLTVLVVLGLIFTGTCRQATTRLFCFVERKSPRSPRIMSTLFKAKTQADTLQSEVRDLLFRERGKMAKLFAYNLIKMICWFLIPAILLFDMENPFAVVPQVSLTAMVFVLAGVIPAPGGIGSLEFVFVLLFGEIVAAAEASSVIILFRLLISVLPFLIGAAVVAVHRQEGETISEFAAHS